jgi:hypothetical protein
MKMLSKLAHQAPHMTNLIHSGLVRRATPSEKQVKRSALPPAARRAFDPIAYAAALEVLG